MFHGLFRVSRPRHPLARVLAGVLSVVAVLALVALGAFVLAALVVGGALLMLVNAFRAARRPRADAAAPKPAPAGVIEGEFTVVSGERVATRR
jgi:hypothetical protein